LGKKYAAPADPLQTTGTRKVTDLRYEGGFYSGFGVVQDGKLITSGACPSIERSWGIPSKAAELTMTFIKAIGEK